MTKVKNKRSDSAYEVYMALYHQLSGEDNFETFKQFKPNFFELIVIDECHRGSAKEESDWRKILDYFSTATHIGCTATPIETKQASNQTYFGEPIYEYSLKQGINDGFLAPYKVICVGLDKDLVGYRPEAGKMDDKGYEIDDREYNIKDFDRTLVLDQRTKAVAAKITEFLKKTDRMSKTIVFCIDVEHAERMRQALINENKDLYKENDKYIMRITGDNPEGKKQLANFIDEEKDYPVIAVTSRLMTTGVDCKMCKLIVLDNIFSDEHGMTEFRQIIGRGTRLLEDKEKIYFTIMDFRNASRLFADKDFDGTPDVVVDIPDGDEIIDPQVEPDNNEPNTVSGKYLRKISNRTALQSADNAEKFITTRKIDSFESLAKFTADSEQKYQQLEMVHLSKGQKLSRLKELSKMYARYEPIQAAYKESQSLKGFAKMKYDKEHKDTLSKSPELRERMQSLLQQGEKITPKQWKAEIQSLQTEYDSIGREKSKTATELAYAEVISYNKKNLGRELQNESRQHSRKQDSKQRNRRQEI